MPGRRRRRLLKPGSRGWVSIATPNGYASIDSPRNVDPNHSQGGWNVVGHEAATKVTPLTNGNYFVWWSNVAQPGISANASDVVSSCGLKIAVTISMDTSPAPTEVGSSSGITASCDTANGRVTGAARAPRPVWVTHGVQSLRSYFRGKPEPSRVSWGRDSKRNWVTIVFPKLETCVLCRGGPVTVGHTVRRTVTGRRATITWYRSGTPSMSISIQRR